MKTKPGLLHYSIAFFVLLFTCLFCNWPNFHPEEHAGLHYHWALDMLFHGGYFFMATIVLLWLLSPFVKKYWVYVPLWLLSFLLEIIQLWVPGRSFTLLDLSSNTLGISMGVLVFWYGRKIQQADGKV